MDDLEIEPVSEENHEVQVVAPSEIKEENRENGHHLTLDLDLTDQSTINDILVNENGCMEDTTGMARHKTTLLKSVI